MAIDTAEKRKSVAGYQPFHVSVTPNVSPDVEWRHQAGWGYPGFTQSVGTYPLRAFATDSLLHADKSFDEAGTTTDEVFLIDEAGNFLVDEAGNFLVAISYGTSIALHGLATDSLLHAEDTTVILLHGLATDSLLHAEAT